MKIKDRELYFIFYILYFFFLLLLFLGLGVMSHVTVTNYHI